MAFWHRPSGTIFTGDLVAQGSSVMIHWSRGGDLAQYLASLERVLTLAPRRLLPAHGPAIDDPRTVLLGYLEHRRQRERQALVALLIVRDLRWRRAQAQLREQLAATRAQVSEHQQLAHVGQLMSGLAQELKGPLQGVIGNTELMIAAGGLGAASATALREIQENATRA